nr:TadE/TadG family type IV pilus assembly protein [uncultured Aggregatibacter sp.]
MSVTESFLSRLSQKIKAFYLDQQGVYGVMTALLLLPLIILVAFTVETTGILLDKTRLSQATDQAALLLTAENNEFRAKKDHSDLMRQNLTAQEKALPADKQFSTRVAKRNQELVQDTVKLYLRSYGEGANAPITITKDFTAFCEPISKSGKAEEGVTCTVQGDVRRKNGFGIIDEWVKSPDGRLPVNSGASYAVKTSGGVPMEVMLVADFSGSMNQDLNNGSGKPTKIEVLKQVVNEVTSNILTQDSVNRVGFSLFTAGARQWKDKHCQIPILPKTGEAEKKVSYEVRIYNYYNNSPRDEFIKAITQKYGRSDGYFHDCEDYYQETEDPVTHTKKKELRGYKCKAEDTREEAIKILISEWNDNEARDMIKRDYIDLVKSVNQIDQFDGKIKKYGLVVDINQGTTPTYICAGKGGETSSITTQAWFEGESGQKALMNEFNPMLPNNQTNSSSGMLMATNAMVAPDPAYRAKLDKLGKNSRKIMVILSDGYDNFPYHGAFIDFEKNGMCTKIKDRLNRLQSTKYEKEDTRLAFVAISYDPAAYGKETADAWKRCVDDYYYVVKNKQQLLDAFNEILGLQEELGTTSSQKIKRK